MQADSGRERAQRPSPEKRSFFEKYDLGKIREIESKEIPHWYPTDCDMTKLSRYQRDALYYYGVKNVDDMFTKRNLWALVDDPACDQQGENESDCVML